MTNIVEEFFLKFGTDAKAARADITDLDNKITEFAKKGDKRTEDEKKQLAAMRKLRAERLADFKDLTHKTDDLAGSFGKLTGAFTGAILGADLIKATLSKIKEAVVDAADYNFELSKTATLTGINANELATWDTAFQQGGASAGDFLGYIKQLNTQYASLGVNDRIKNVPGDILKLKDAWDKLSDAQKVQRANQLQLSEGGILFLTQSREAILQELEAAKLYNNETAETAKTGKEIYQTTSLIGAEWKSIGTEFQPILLLLDKFVLAMEVGLHIVILLAEALGNLATLDFSGAWKDLKQAGNLWWQSGEQLDETGPYAKGATPSAGATSAAPTVNAPSAGATSAAPTVNAPSAGAPSSAPRGIRSNNPGNLQPGGRESVFGSLQEGVAAEEAQLGRYGRKGVTTLAGIALRWPDQANAATWLQTVSKYSGYAPNQPLNLADPTVQAKISNAINVAENGPAFANLIATAQSNISAANQSPLNSTMNSGNSSVTIGSITIHSQATDASGVAGDIHSELQKQYSQTINSYDDSVLY